MENAIATVNIKINESHIEELDVTTAVQYATQFIDNSGRQRVDLPFISQARFQKLVFLKDCCTNEIRDLEPLNSESFMGLTK